MRGDRNLKAKIKSFEMKKNIILATTIIGFTALATSVNAESEEHGNQQKIAMSDMPAAVQKTIQDNLDGTEGPRELSPGFSLGRLDPTAAL